MNSKPKEKNVLLSFIYFIINKVFIKFKTLSDINELVLLKNVKQKLTNTENSLYW